MYLNLNLIPGFLLCHNMEAVASQVNSRLDSLANPVGP